MLRYRKLQLQILLNAFAGQVQGCRAPQESEHLHSAEVPGLKHFPCLDPQRGSDQVERPQRSAEGSLEGSSFPDMASTRQQWDRGLPQ